MLEAEKVDCGEPLDQSALARPWRAEDDQSRGGGQPRADVDGRGQSRGMEFPRIGKAQGVVGPGGRLPRAGSTLLDTDAGGNVEPLDLQLLGRDLRTALGDVG